MFSCLQNSSSLYITLYIIWLFDREKGVVVGASTFHTWNNVPLANLVEDRTGRPVRRDTEHFKREGKRERERERMCAQWCC